MKKLQNYIDGAFVDPVSGQWLDNYCPSTGKVYSQVAASEKEDIGNAVAAAKKAFPSWSATPVEKRAKYLYDVALGIEKRLEEFANAESQDQGKTLQTAMTIDIPRAIANFRFYAGHILHHEEVSTVMESPVRAINFTARQPYGVAALISPWNLPLYLASWKVAPAIACGNTCVLKPSELSPLTAYLLGEVLSEAGVPPGVVNIVHGLGPKAGQALIEHPDVAIISFTGGTATGKHIARVAAPLMKKLSLELGGKNANIVFADCDADACITTSLRSSFANQGEICLCGSRILVERSFHDEFVRRLVEATKKLHIGDPSDANSFYGALISAAHLAKVKKYVELAKEEGGTVHCGGEFPGNIPEAFKGGFFLTPTIISGLSSKARCCQEEIFGPVVTVIPFDDEADAIAKANDTQYGLSSSIWTKDGAKANRVALGLHCGYIWVNCWLLRDLRMPFGGMKGSGVGREGGKYAIDFYSDVKTICSKL